MLAAASASTYLSVKVVWIALSAAGTATPAGWTVTGWVALNAVTVVMAAAGGLFGLAIARGWHRALPAPVLVTAIWLVSGFLISLLPYMVASTLLESLGVLGGGDGSSRSDDSDSALGGAEAALIGFSFGGIALGVLVGLPAYLLQRWPWLRSRERPAPARPSTRATRARVTAAAIAVLVGSWWLAWGSGLDLGTRGAVEGQYRLLEATLGAWALLTGVLVLNARPTRRPALTDAALFVGSGSMFAWSAWRLAVSVWDPPGYDAPASMPVLALQYSLAIGAAGVVLHAVLERCRARDAMRAEPPGNDSVDTESVVGR